MEFYLIRHGETDWNKEKKLQGREDIPLNEDGIAQAHVCGKALQGIHFDQILSSPLSRAMDTARILASYAGNPPITIEENLIERDFGDLSGMCYAQKNVFGGFEGDDHSEPLEDVQKRMMGVLNHYCEAYEKRILVISHGAALNGVLAALGVKEHIRLCNASINIVRYADHEYQLVKLNCDPREGLT